MIEPLFNSLSFVQWQLFIAFIILLSRTFIAPLLPFILLGLTIWTWEHTSSDVFIVQMLVIMFVGGFALNMESWLPPTISIIILSDGKSNF